MMKRLLLVLIIAFGLGGCTGLTQFPVATKDYNQALRDLDADYAMTVNRIYGPVLTEGNGGGTTPSTGSMKSAFVPPSAEEQKQIRKEMMERRMAVIDAYFKEFQAGLVKENVRSEFGIELLGVGVGAAGSLVPETASQILSAVSGGLAGAQAAYGKATLYEKTMSALVAQMRASRKEVAAQIFQRWNLDLDLYPMWMARMDLDAYYFAGSLPGAILSTAADAKLKEKKADEILLRPITTVNATEAMFDQRDDLKSIISKLDGFKAKKLVAAIENAASRSECFKEAKKILDDQYPIGLRSKDTDGKKAIVVLRRAVVHSVRSPGDTIEWETLIDKIDML